MTMKESILKAAEKFEVAKKEYDITKWELNNLLKQVTYKAKIIGDIKTSVQAKLEGLRFDSIHKVTPEGLILRYDDWHFDHFEDESFILVTFEELETDSSITKEKMRQKKERVDRILAIREERRQARMKKQDEEWERSVYKELHEKYGNR